MKELQDTTLIRIAEADGQEYAPEYGERSWRVRGRYADIVYWDLGNGWCDITRIIPKKGHEDWLQIFFDRVEETDDDLLQSEAHLDGEG